MSKFSKVFSSMFDISWKCRLLVLQLGMDENSQGQTKSTRIQRLCKMWERSRRIFPKLNAADRLNKIKIKLQIVYSFLLFLTGLLSHRVLGNLPRKPAAPPPRVKHDPGDNIPCPRVIFNLALKSVTRHTYVIFFSVLPVVSHGSI
jgi:hypothetical protein